MKKASKMAGAVVLSVSSRLDYRRMTARYMEEREVDDREVRMGREHMIMDHGGVEEGRTTQGQLRLQRVGATKLAPLQTAAQAGAPSPSADILSH